MFTSPQTSFVIPASAIRVNPPSTVDPISICFHSLSKREPSLIQPTTARVHLFFLQSSLPPVLHRFLRILSATHPLSLTLPPLVGLFLKFAHIKWISLLVEKNANDKNYYVVWVATLIYGMSLI